MEWIKIFSSDTEARTQVRADAPRLLVIGKIRICLALHQDRFYAVQDSCTHNGESLSKGTINYLGEVICPWHNYRFELSTGNPCDSSCAALKTYPIKTDRSGFFIGV